MENSFNIRTNGLSDEISLKVVDSLKDLLKKFSFWILEDLKIL